MELRHLRCFLTVANALSFRRAAAQLGTMPSSVSRTIAVLEDELGVELFGRSGRGAQLTQVGRTFHRDAQAIVAAVDRARETAGSVASGCGGQLRLGICEGATTPTFAAVLAGHREQCPAVELELVEMQRDRKSTRLNSRQSCDDRMTTIA